MAAKNYMTTGRVNMSYKRRPINQGNTKTKGAEANGGIFQKKFYGTSGRFNTKD